MSGRGRAWNPNLPVIEEEEEEKGEESNDEKQLVRSNAGAVIQPVIDSVVVPICPICHRSGAASNPLIQPCRCQPGYHEHCTNLAILTPISTAPNPCGQCGQPLEHPNLHIRYQWRPEDLLVPRYFAGWLCATIAAYFVHDVQWDEHSDGDIVEPICLALLQMASIAASSQFGKYYFDPDWPPPPNRNTAIMTFRDYNPVTQLREPGRHYRMDLMDEQRAYNVRRQQLADQLSREQTIVDNIQNEIIGEFGVEDVDQVTNELFDFSHLTVQQRDRLRILLEQLDQSYRRQRQLHQQL